MTDNRRYDKSLVAAIRAKEHEIVEGGMPMLLKPIPDDDREHVLDPRVREVAARKKSMFSARASKNSGAFSLANERFRPDKVTYDLNEGQVTVGERLIDVNGTHRIDVFTYASEKKSGKAGGVEKAPRPVYVFLHGGGFTAGCERLYHNQMRYIAEASDALVVFPEYRLAPEAPFPAAIEDCIATIEWVRGNAAELGVDPNRIMVGGDSAGGSLTCACLLKDRDRAISRAYLLFPACDSSNYLEQSLYEWSFNLYPVIDEDRELAYSRIDRIRSNCTIPIEDNSYVQGRAPLADPLISVAYAADEQLAEFPPITIAVSEYDYLRIGAEYTAKRLRELGKDVRLVRYCGCDHGFLDLFGSEPQAEEVCLDMADEISKM